jgi:hypothetical protein
MAHVVVVVVVVVVVDDDDDDDDDGDDFLQIQLQLVQANMKYLVAFTVYFHFVYLTPVKKQSLQSSLYLLYIIVFPE